MKQISLLRNFIGIYAWPSVIRKESFCYQLLLLKLSKLRFENFSFIYRIVSRLLSCLDINLQLQILLIDFRERHSQLYWQGKTLETTWVFRHSYCVISIQTSIFSSMLTPYTPVINRVMSFYYSYWIWEAQNCKCVSNMNHNSISIWEIYNIAVTTSDSFNQ